MTYTNYLPKALRAICIVLLLGLIVPVYGLQLIPKDVTCEGENAGQNGELELVIDGGRAPHTIVWSTGETGTMKLTDLMPGTYSVTVTDADGCVAEESQSVQIEGLRTTISGGGTRVVCEGESVNVTLAASSECSDCDFSWSNGSTGRSISVNSSGTYSVTVSHPSNPTCRNTVSATVTITEEDCDDDDDDIVIPRIHAVDPNDIIGPEGVGEERWVSVDEVLPYTIRYENDPEFATAPAQRVTISHPIPEHIDIFSFRLGDFGFGSFIFSVPENSIIYTGRVDVVDSLGVFVDVTAGVDVTTNEAFWIFESIDPVTGLPPTNAELGYLLVNTDTDRFGDTISYRPGEGFVTFTVKPENDSQTGDSILAEASIVFDFNDAIITPEIFNIIDADDPVSILSAVSPTADSNFFELSFSATDVGSGLAGYSLYVSEDGGAWTEHTDTIPAGDTTYTFFGQYGRDYAFFTSARDSVNNQEDLKNMAEASVSVNPNAKLVARVFLEGPYCATPCPSGTAAGYMDTLLNSRGMLPLEQPYDSLLAAPGVMWGYNGDESVDAIPDTRIVDWLLISLRTDSSAASAFDTMAVFLRNDGYMLDMEGDSIMDIQLVAGVDSFLLVVEHHNHLIVMSSNHLQGDSENIYTYDFSDDATKAYTLNGSAGLVNISSSDTYGAFGGNSYADPNINPNDNAIWETENLMFNQYLLRSNYNLDLNVNPDDRSIWLRNNLIYSEVPR